MYTVNTWQILPVKAATHVLILLGIKSVDVHTSYLSCPFKVLTSFLLLIVVVFGRNIQGNSCLNKWELANWEIAIKPTFKQTKRKAYWMAICNL
ncbi:hypothetical protein AHAS_Ahas19G0381400 [Arachis hypogaea]